LNRTATGGSNITHVNGTGVTIPTPTQSSQGNLGAVSLVGLSLALAGTIAMVCKFLAISHVSYEAI